MTTERDSLERELTALRRHRENEQTGIALTVVSAIAESILVRGDLTEHDRKDTRRILALSNAVKQTRS